MIPRNPWERKVLLALLDRFIVPVIIILVGISAFFLGRLSVLEEGRGNLIIHPPEDRNAIAQPVDIGEAEKGFVQMEKNFVASKNGSRYYLPSCSGVGNIKEENKIWFATAAAAEAAGYTLAANCTF